MSNISLRYIESIYAINYKGNNYKFTLIEDLETGQVDYTIMKYNKKGELVNPTEKQYANVAFYFNQNN